MALTILFRAPTRVGLPHSQVVRCSCGSISEIPSPLVSPNNSAAWQRWESCSACRSATSRRQLEHAHNKLTLKHAGFGTLANKVAPTTPAQIDYFAKAPHVLPWDRIAFKPDAAAVLGAVEPLNDVDLKVIATLRALHARLHPRRDELHVSVQPAMNLLNQIVTSLPNTDPTPKEPSHDSGHQAHP